ncbi:hypothetical protein [Polynucleobacter sp. IMCC 29146]|uniref:hypothetical protein n=1 Tax=Polynucleobacter sp. IMCC 29146 TaxID=2780953 RepID=UPI001F3915EA|nr:hypothetical protein [Polynucleobacter sp. IMCC 29146]MCE7530726.1 hypothetical protein [Polynucleobacter sp. IMCC 29146]
MKSTQFGVSYPTYSALLNKSILILLIATQLILSIRPVFAQAIYGPEGQYRGYSQTSPSGVTNVYNAAGQNTQSFQTDHGQTSFYSPQGQYQGVSTAPVVMQPNTTLGAPRQAPQAPSVKGW